VKRPAHHARATRSARPAAQRRPPTATAAQERAATRGEPVRASRVSSPTAVAPAPVTGGADLAPYLLAVALAVLAAVSAQTFRRELRGG
jgi:hypothetical protein